MSDGASVPAQRGGSDELEAAYDIPVKVSIRIGQTVLAVKDLLKKRPGEVLELDRTIDAQCDIFVNDILVAHGHLVQEDQTGQDPRLSVVIDEVLRARRSS